MAHKAYYNENEPYAAAWLRNLIDEGLLADGDVDERSIMEVSAGDLRGYAQCHFFAGIGGWPHALDLAGWPRNRAVWTGSCPCQPFSVAGTRRGDADERHLWPAWFRLVRECCPAVVLGEQVAGAIARGWLDGVFADLEGEGYACAAAVLPACGVGAPHRRDRLWFVADAAGARRAGGFREAGAVLDRHQPGNGGEAVADAGLARLPLSERQELRGAGRRQEGRATAEHGGWAVEPGMGRMAHGVPARVAKLRALGNAVVPQVAAEVVAAYLAHDALQRELRLRAARFGR